MSETAIADFKLHDVVKDTQDNSEIDLIRHAYGGLICKYRASQPVDHGVISIKSYRAEPRPGYGPYTHHDGNFANSSNDYRVVSTLRGRGHGTRVVGTTSAVDLRAASLDGFCSNGRQEWPH